VIALSVGIAGMCGRRDSRNVRRYEPTRLPQRHREPLRLRPFHGGECYMFWIGTTVMVVVDVVALMVVLLITHPADVEDLGAVSDHWIAAHRVDSPWASSR
jgi:hypothetical protein